MNVALFILLSVIGSLLFVGAWALFWITYMKENLVLCILSILAIFGITGIFTFVCTRLVIQ